MAQPGSGAAAAGDGAAVVARDAAGDNPFLRGMGAFSTFSFDEESPEDPAGHDASSEGAFYAILTRSLHGMAFYSCACSALTLAAYVARVMAGMACPWLYPRPATVLPILAYEQLLVVQCLPSEGHLTCSAVPAADGILLGCPSFSLLQMRGKGMMCMTPAAGTSRPGVSGIPL